MFTTTSAFSLRKYWVVDGTIDVPRLGSDRVSAQLYGRRRDYPQEDFFGLGPDSRVEDQTDFRLKDTAVRGGLAFHLTPWLSAGGAVGTWPLTCQAEPTRDTPTRSASSTLVSPLD